MKALVIDDSRAIRHHLAKMLKDLGFDVSVAGHGREGLEQLTAGTDLITVDWNMPEMNGLELVAAARPPPHYDTTRIVMVTTETEMSQVERALSAGAQEYVMKPFTRDVLEEKLRVLGLAG